MNAAAKVATLSVAVTVAAVTSWTLLQGMSESGAQRPQVHTPFGAIADKYQALGDERGSLGALKTDEPDVPHGGKSDRFVNGVGSDAKLLVDTGAGSDAPDTLLAERTPCLSADDWPAVFRPGASRATPEDPAFWQQVEAAFRVVRDLDSPDAK
jgi:hypothetical protein